MNSKSFELVLTKEADAHVIQNLWPLYVQDISAYDGAKPNQHGVLVDDPATRAWQGPGNWWNKPDVLFPYLILVDGMPAGFNLVSSGPYIPTEGVDFTVHEFFVAHAYRGTGAAVWGAQAGINKHPGNWEVVTYPSALGPQKFWRKTLPAIASDGVTETEEDHPWGRKVVWRFRND